jgi:hypothetical protein
MMLNNQIKKAAIGAAAIATLIVAPAMAKPEHQPFDQRAVVVHRQDVPGEAFASAIRLHSPNPAWDVYSGSGRHYIGSDPDPRIREELRREWEFRD